MKLGTKLIIGFWLAYWHIFSSGRTLLWIITKTCGSYQEKAEGLNLYETQNQVNNRLFQHGGIAVYGWHDGISFNK
jgi:hypothetical protein